MNTFRLRHGPMNCVCICLASPRLTTAANNITAAEHTFTPCRVGCCTVLPNYSHPRSRFHPSPVTRHPSPVMSLVRAVHMFLNISFLHTRLDAFEPEPTTIDLLGADAIKKHEHTLELLTRASCRGSVQSCLKKPPTCLQSHRF